MTAEQVAEHLQISLQTVRNMTSKRQIPFFKIGSAVRYRMSDIDKWTDHHKEGPGKNRSRA